MDLEKTGSKKWVDYSDDSEEQFQSDEEHHHTKHHHHHHKNGQGQTSTQPKLDPQSPEYKQQQLKRLKQCPVYHKQVWVEFVCPDQTYLDKKVVEFKDLGHQDISQIFISNHRKGAWDLKAKKTLAQKWIKEGVDQQKKIQVIVADRNFRDKNEENNQDKNGDRRGERGERGGRGERRERGGRGERRERGDRGQRRQRGDRQERGERGERRGRGRGNRDRDNNEGRNGERGDRRRRDRDDQEGDDKKKVYVDKVTGQPPTNKQACQQKLMEEKERHYTRQQAQKIGMQLGNFRTKSKVESKPEQDETPKKQIREQEYNRIDKKQEGEPQKGKKQVAMWGRKQRNDKQEETPKQKSKYMQKPSAKYAQKKVDTQEQKHENHDKKKKYVRVDQMNEKQMEEMKQKKSQPPLPQEERKAHDFLDEDTT